MIIRIPINRYTGCVLVAIIICIVLALSIESVLPQELYDNLRYKGYLGIICMALSLFASILIFTFAVPKKYQFFKKIRNKDYNK